jgi:hypothetical protein
MNMERMIEVDAIENIEIEMESGGFMKLQGKKIVAVRTHVGSSSHDCGSLVLEFDDGTKCEFWPTTNEEIEINWSVYE